jgi:hypothetical protein
MYPTSPIKSGQMYAREGKQFATHAGTVAGAVPFGGYDFPRGNPNASGYDYYSGGVAAVRSLAPLNVIAGHKE